MGFDYMGAVKAGYSDQEIQDYLKKSGRNFDVVGAKKAGYSDEEISSHLSSSKPKGALNPVVNFLMGNAIRTAQDVGTAIAQRTSGVNESQQAALDMQAKLDAMARNADPEARKRLMAVSADTGKVVGEGARQMSDQYSEDIGQNYLVRGLNTGAEVANTAALVSGGIKLAGKTPELLKNMGNATKEATKYLNPRQLLGEARTAAAAASKAQVNAENIVKAGREYVRLNPEAAPILEKHLPSILEARNPTELLKHMDIWKNAYTQAGKVGKAARSGLFNALYRAGSQEMATAAPEVAKYTALLRLTYEAPKTALKWIFYGGMANQAKNLLGLGK